MTVQLLDTHAEDAETLLVKWLTPLRPSAIARVEGDPLPFTLVTHITGSENVNASTADLVVSVHTLCDKSLGYQAARDEAQKTHDRITYLARHLDTGGTYGAIDFITVFQTPIWVAYEDTRVLRKVGRYTVGLSYVPAN